MTSPDAARRGDRPDAYIGVDKGDMALTFGMNFMAEVALFNDSGVPGRMAGLGEQLRVGSSRGRTPLPSCGHRRDSYPGRSHRTYAGTCFLKLEPDHQFYDAEDVHRRADDPGPSSAPRYPGAGTGSCRKHVHMSMPYKIQKPLAPRFSLRSLMAPRQPTVRAGARSPAPQ